MVKGWSDRSSRLFEAKSLLRVKSEPGKILTLRLRHNDLAIIEFDAAGCREALESRGIKPARLYDGVGYTKPGLEAQIAGFGAFGTNRDPDPQNLLRIHAANTRVTFETWKDRPGFWSWIPLLDEGKETFIRGENQGLMFAPVPAPTEYLRIDETRVLLETHKNQATIMEGDSGGPLFFNTKAGLSLAGIASEVMAEPLVDIMARKGVLAVAQYWTPVKENLPWIRSVMAGESSSSPDLPVTQPKPQDEAK